MSALTMDLFATANNRCTKAVCGSPAAFVFQGKQPLDRQPMPFAVPPILSPRLSNLPVVRLRMDLTECR